MKIARERKRHDRSSDALSAPTLVTRPLSSDKISGETTIKFFYLSAFIFSKQKKIVLKAGLQRLKFPRELCSMAYLKLYVTTTYEIIAIVSVTRIDFN